MFNGPERRVSGASLKARGRLLPWNCLLPNDDGTNDFIWFKSEPTQNCCHVYIPPPPAPPASSPQQVLPCDGSSGVLSVSQLRGSESTSRKGKHARCQFVLLSCSTRRGGRGRGRDRATRRISVEDLLNILIENDRHSGAFSPAGGRSKSRGSARRGSMDRNQTDPLSPRPINTWLLLIGWIRPHSRTRGRKRKIHNPGLNPWSPRTCLWERQQEQVFSLCGATRSEEIKSSSSLC